MSSNDPVKNGCEVIAAAQASKGADLIRKGTKTFDFYPQSISDIVSLVQC